MRQHPPRVPGGHTSAGTTPGFHGLIGNHPSMQKLFDLLRRVGPSRASVLIHGESGTGKELVARAIHELSPRRARALIPVHCGAIPEELLESELFGHTRGAFTGAVSARTGRFALADGGTIFLDEIGEMSPKFQVKLLRVLEDGSYDPVGSPTPQQTDVRVVAASHRDLREAVREGSFREDLLYRLDVVAIHLPPLRQRIEDIPVLADCMLAAVAAGQGVPARRLSPAAAARLQAHPWPGNVRELRNVLERSLLLTDRVGELEPDELCFDEMSSAREMPRLAHSSAPTEICPAQSSDGKGTPWEFGPEGADLYGELEAFEERMIRQALQLSGGSKREAARLLHVNRTTLLEKMKRRGWEFSARRHDCEASALATPSPLVAVA